MKTVWKITLVLVLLVGILAGCGTAVTSETDTNTTPAEGGAGEAGTSAALNGSYEDALTTSSQLALGTILLEGTENTVSPDQAETLLPLWQVIGSGALESEAETDAVLKQIEEAMTPGQLSAIAAMQLTVEDMGAWAQEQGVTLGGPRDGARGSLPEGMTEEQMEEMRAARESGEGGFSPPEAMTGDRAAMRATAEASSITRTDGAAGMGAGQLAALAGTLVEMLTGVAAG